MSYPMKLKKAALVHRGNTKEYFVTLVVNSVGKALVIRRWGAKGAKGQTKVTQFEKVAEAEADYEKELRSRQSGAKGYVLQSDKISTAATQGELAITIGRTITPKLGAANLQFIDPAYDVSGVREPVQTVDEDGNYLGQPVNRVDTNGEAFKAAQREAQLKESEPMRNHPLFGRF